MPTDTTEHFRMRAGQFEDVEYPRSAEAVARDRASTAESVARIEARLQDDIAPRLERAVQRNQAATAATVVDLREVGVTIREDDVAYRNSLRHQADEDESAVRREMTAAHRELRRLRARHAALDAEDRAITKLARQHSANAAALDALVLTGPPKPKPGAWLRGLFGRASENPGIPSREVAAQREEELRERQARRAQRAAAIEASYASRWGNR